MLTKRKILQLIVFLITLIGGIEGSVAGGPNDSMEVDPGENIGMTHLYLPGKFYFYGPNDFDQIRQKQEHEIDFTGEYLQISEIKNVSSGAVDYFFEGRFCGVAFSLVSAQKGKVEIEFSNQFPLTKSEQYNIIQRLWEYCRYSRLLRGITSIKGSEKFHIKG